MAKTFTSQDLLIPPNFDFQFPEKISKANLTEDIDILIHTLKNSYGGFLYYDSHTKNTILRKLKKISLSANISKPTVQVCQEIAKIFDHLPDKHFHVKLVENCSLENRVEKEINVGKNIAKIANEKKPWILNYQTIENMRIPVLGIQRFASGQDQSWNGYLEALELAKLSPHLIFDLRGNPGGDADFVFKTLYHLYGKDITERKAKIKQWNTAEAWALWWNRYLLKKLEFDKKGKNPPKHLIDLIKTYKNQYYRILETHPEKILTRSANPNIRQKKEYPPYQGNIYVLADKNCGSSCDIAVELFKNFPNTTIIGTNTNGAIHFGNMMVFILPNTKIQVYLPVQYLEYENGQFLEGKGIQPDIYLRDGQDALQKALSIIKNRNKN